MPFLRCDPCCATVYRSATPLVCFSCCSEAQLEQLCEQLYADGLAVAKQAVLYVLAEEEEEREEPPGGCFACIKAALYSAWRFCCIACSGLVAVEALECLTAAPAATFPPASPSTRPNELMAPPHTPAIAAPLELSLVVCDDAHITELNREWRGVDGPTDVLSFELEDDEDETGCKPEVGC